MDKLSSTGEDGQPLNIWGRQTLSRHPGNDENHLVAKTKWTISLYLVKRATSSPGRDGQVFIAEAGQSARHVGE